MEERSRRYAIAVVAIVHILLALALRSAMISEPPTRVVQASEDAIDVVFYPSAASEPMPSSPAAEATPASAQAPLDTAIGPTDAPREAGASPKVIINSEPPAMTARFVPAEPERPKSAASTAGNPVRDDIRLINKDGSLRLSKEVLEAADARAEPDFKTPSLEQPEFMTRESPVEYRETRFEKYWVPDKESLPEELARKYPIARLLLQGVGGDRCPPRSTDPECEGEVQPAFADDPVPDEDLLE